MTKPMKNVSLYNITSTFIIGSLTFVAALSWRDLIKKIFIKCFGEDDTIKALAIYTIGLTLVTVFLTYLMYRYFKQTKDDN